MSPVLLHPRTAAQLTQMAHALPQALIFSGPQGSGKLFAAQHWLMHDLTVPAACIRVIAPLEKSNITVDQIRELYHATRTKQSSRQFFVLDGAGSMSSGAQNAFLKLLEEPNQAIHFILTTHTLEDLLPTIRSRAQQVAIHPVHNDALLAYLQQHHQLDSATQQQILFIARGRAGLAAQLAANPDLFANYKQLAAAAKQVLVGTPFERLATLTTLSDRPQALTFLEITANMASMLLQRATKKEEQYRWVQRISAIHETLERLSANANLKIQLTRLALIL